MQMPLRLVTSSQDPGVQKSTETMHLERLLQKKIISLYTFRLTKTDTVQVNQCGLR